MDKSIPVVYFYIPNQVTILDLSGVVQVFEEAKFLGFNYHFKFISNQSNIKSYSGLEFTSLIDYRKTNPSK